jgi:hypothetical protein
MKLRLTIRLLEFRKVVSDDITSLESSKCGSLCAEATSVPSCIQIRNRGEALTIPCSCFCMTSTCCLHKPKSKLCYTDCQSASVPWCQALISEAKTKFWLLCCLRGWSVGQITTGFRQHSHSWLQFPRGPWPRLLLWTVIRYLFCRCWLFLLKLSLDTLYHLRSTENTATEPETKVAAVAPYCTVKRGGTANLYDSLKSLQIAWCQVVLKTQFPMSRSRSSPARGRECKNWWQTPVVTSLAELWYLR